MPRSESSNSKNVPSFEAPRHRPKWMWASVCFFLATLLTVAFFDFQPGQSYQHTTSPTDVNLVGRFGAEVSWWTFHMVGASTWLIPGFFYWLAYILMRRIRRMAGARLVAMVFCTAAVSGLIGMQERFFTDPSYFTAGPGGLLGEAIYDGFLRDSVGTFGAGMLLSMVSILGFLFVLTRDIGSEFEKMLASYNEWRRRGQELRQEQRKQRQELKRLKAEAKLKEKVEAASGTTPSVKPVLPPPGKKFTLPKSKDDPLRTTAPFTIPSIPGAAAARPEKALSLKTAAAAPESKPSGTPGKALKIISAEATRKANVTLPQRSGDYTRPPMETLKPAAKPEGDTDTEEHAQNMATLIRTLGEFGVEVTEDEVHIGPVITRYDILPAPGVRVEKISGLDKNLALALKAQSVRILAPVPGKGCVGVEVPNQNPTPVGLREILESEDWVDSRAELPIALGKDVSGSPLLSDLTRMPHLLIAGATGSGKSVCINSIIAALVYHAGPKDLRFLMIDPKIVELKIFNDLPHMLIPVVTDPKKVPGALKWLLSEMEQRYQIFAKVGVRNITSFNNRKIAPPEPPTPEENAEEAPKLEVPRDDEIEIPEKLHYIVAIVDELADLMMVSPAEVETSIARLAQLARAAGIHLIIATQRPSVNVITGVIKANLPSRIAFQVASKVDSRTILDTGGAEQLIGRGDMLFSPPGSSKLIRAQGGFVSDDEISAIVEFLKKNGPPQYAKEIQDQIDSSGDEGEAGAGDEAGDDDMLPQAIDVLKSTRRASTSMLQRRLRIGYNRAARLMEIMESRGIVGPENGAQPREILVDLDSL